MIVYFKYLCRIEFSGKCSIEINCFRWQKLLECKEELNIALDVGEVFMEIIHEYPDITVHLTLFNATIVKGVPQKLERNDIKWITPAEIFNYDFCLADEEILKKIKKEKINVR